MGTVLHTGGRLATGNLACGGSGWYGRMIYVGFPFATVYGIYFLAVLTAGALERGQDGTDGSAELQISVFPQGLLVF